VDSSSEVLRSNIEKFPQYSFQCFDVCGSVFPFNNNEFDNIILAAFIEHIDNPKVMMTEAKRVLKPDGLIVITTPSKWGGFVHEMCSNMGLLSHEAAEEHKGFVNLDKMKEVVRSTGLSVDHYEPFQLGLNQLFLLKKGEAHE